jgi:hypothetical protein
LYLAGVESRVLIAAPHQFFVRALCNDPALHFPVARPAEKYDLVAVHNRPHAVGNNDARARLRGVISYQSLDDITNFGLCRPIESGCILIEEEELGSTFDEAACD